MLAGEPAGEIPCAVQAALDEIPISVLCRSGKVFYSGRAAFARPSPLYIVGLNPGGDPLGQAGETIANSLDLFRAGSVHWSEYADASWRGARPGTWGLQPRVLHLLTALGMDPRLVPASNVVFARSATEAELEVEKRELLSVCWPVHHAVIDALQIKVVLCFGSTAGRWVRNELNAHRHFDTYTERNMRGWRSEAHRAADGRAVVTLTHPGRANWCNPNSDPTPLVERVLAAVGA